MNRLVFVSPLTLLLALPGCSATEATAQEVPATPALSVAMAEVDRLVELYLAQDLAGMRRLEETAVRDDPSLRQPCPGAP